MRDYFAAQALVGILAGEEGNEIPELNSANAYAYADAMMKARQPGGIEILRAEATARQKQAYRPK